MFPGVLLFVVIPGNGNVFVEFDEKVYRLKSDLLRFIHHPNMDESIFSAINEIHTFENQNASREKNSIELFQRILIKGMKLLQCFKA